MLEHERWLALVLLLPMLLSEGVRSSTRDILKNIRSLLMLVLAPLAAMIVQMAISRTREYAADNLGARISARPMHWLRRSSKSRAQRKPCQTTLRNPHPATAPLSIVNPLSGRGMDNLFSTHPSTENRVAALDRLSHEMGLGGFGPSRPVTSSAWSGPWGDGAERE
jgi:heat shock protein HtpX